MINYNKTKQKDSCGSWNKVIPIKLDGINFQLIGEQDKFFPATSKYIKHIYKGKVFQIKNKDYLEPMVLHNCKLPFVHAYNGDYNITHSCSCNSIVIVPNVDKQDNDNSVLNDYQEIKDFMQKEFYLEISGNKIIDAREEIHNCYEIKTHSYQCKKCKKRFIAITKNTMGRFDDWRHGIIYPSLKVYEIWEL